MIEKKILPLEMVDATAYYFREDLHIRGVSFGEYFCTKFKINDPIKLETNLRSAIIYITNKYVERRGE